MIGITGVILLLLIVFVISLNLHNEPSLEKIYNPELFTSDISNNKNKIVYDTIPYGSSGLFYDYVFGTPYYYYNPLDYWLNPYYYSWYGPGLQGSFGGPTSYSSTYTTSTPHVKKVKHIRRMRRRYY